MEANLRERVQAVEDRFAAGCAQRLHLHNERNDRRLSTGWDAVDAAIGGGLPWGALHEWLGVEMGMSMAGGRGTGASMAGRMPAPPTPSAGRTLTPLTSAAGRIPNPPTFSAGRMPALPASSAAWSPPVSILAHLAARALHALEGLACAVWIGRTCFPYGGRLLAGASESGAPPEAALLRTHSIFVDAPDARKRLWAVDLALRSPAVGLVLFDASRFDMAATRRVQLLARTHGVLALAIRPPREIGELSAARSRWRIAWAAVGPAARRPCWRVELLRFRSASPTVFSPSWLLEWNDVESAVHLSAELGDSAGATPAWPAGPSRRALGAG